MKTYYNLLTCITILSVVQTVTQEVQSSYELLGTIPGAVEPQLLDDIKTVAVINNDQICYHTLERNLPLQQCLPEGLLIKHFKRFAIHRSMILALVYLEPSNPNLYHLQITKDGQIVYQATSEEDIIPIDFYFGRISDIPGRSWLIAKIESTVAILNYDSRVSGWIQLGTIVNKNEFCLTPTHSYFDHSPFIYFWYLKQFPHSLDFIHYESPCTGTTKTQTINPIAYNNKHNLLVTPTYTGLVRSLVQTGRPEDECFNNLYDHKEAISYLASEGDIVCAGGATKISIADINTGDLLQTIEGNYIDLDISLDGEFITARDESNNAVVVWKRKD